MNFDRPLPEDKLLAATKLALAEFEQCQDRVVIAQAAMARTMSQTLATIAQSRELLDKISKVVDPLVQSGRFRDW